MSSSFEENGSETRFKLLYVEDEDSIRENLERLLLRMADEVVSARNGVEGLELFDTESVNIVITDIRMPKMNGLEMIRHIRLVDSEIPIIVTTAHNETELLMEAIDLGVTQFVLKPIDMKKLGSAIEKCKNLAQVSALRSKLQERNIKLQEAYEELAKAKEAQAQLFHYQQRYHTLQQENALKKQLKIIRDDLSHLIIDDIAFDLFYKPLDILSGDTYGTINLGGGEYMIYILDAMGKGLSASVTAILSTSYINNQIENAMQQGDFSFQEMIRSFVAYIRKQLLQDEMLCALFVLYDSVNQTLSIANFAMPPVLLHDFDGHIEQLTSNNLPIMPFYKSSNIQTIDFSKCRKVLFYSDGINESLTTSGGCYQSELIDDFQSSITHLQFIEKLTQKISSFDDDTTAISMSRLNSFESIRKFTIETSYDNVDHAEKEIMRLLENGGYGQKSIHEFLIVLVEMIVNAIEHGNLGISGERKQQMLSDGTYDEFLHNELLREENFKKNITIELLQYKNCEENALFAISVRDEGDGFAVKETLTDLGLQNKLKFHGRGIKMAKTFSDGLYYTPQGNESMVIKFISKATGAH